MLKFKSVTFDCVSIDDGFWNKKQQMNCNTTIHAVYNRFVETGRIEAFKGGWKPDEPDRHQIFWDSDVAKWIEAVSYICRTQYDAKLAGIVDELVEQIEKNQWEDGYFNTYYMTIEPQSRWKVRTGHELYCAGHLMEAAVAYYQATGKDKFLKLMCKFADHIEQVFAKEKSAGYITPGHEEIELALVRLYRTTGERRYLELSKFFLDNRGKDSPTSYYSYANARYAQDHASVRDQHTAEGHAVRAVYLYSAMADNAYEFEDRELFTACRNIFEDIAYRKMYITGGIGSTSNGEAFTTDYDLPNRMAYAESCAAIGLVLFASRMLQLEADSLYSDVIERVLYNGFLSSVSLDGEAFFYENPLEVCPGLHMRDTAVKKPQVWLPLTKRVGMFNCSCCPPNIARFIGSMGGLLYTYNEDTVFIHQYMNSKTAFDVAGRTVEIIQETDYPWNGKVAIRARGMAGMHLAVRIPGWCLKYGLSGGGGQVAPESFKGYVHLKCTENDISFVLDFEMEPVLMEASPNVQENSGRVALQRGPVVYCLEEADNGKNLRDIALDANTGFKIYFDKYFDACVIEADGYRRDAGRFRNLYQPVDDSCRMKARIKFIPYFAFANRAENEMIIWISAS